MQTASSTLTSAILAQERLPIARVEVDFDRDGFGGAGTIDDLTDDVVSISIDRSLSTDLPPEVKLFTGYSTAQATIVLARQTVSPTPTSTSIPYGAPIPYGDANYSYAGTGTAIDTSGAIRHTTWYYSPFNSNSPLFGKRRLNAPARVSLGMVGAAGAEYLVVFTGRVRSLEVDASSRSVTLVLGDLAETMRKQVSLPMVVADGETASSSLCPGLNTTFLADYVARQCGYYASPAPRTGCLVSATMHGSGWPEVGTLAQYHGANNTMLAFSPTTGFPKSAPWVMAVNLNGTDTQLITYVLAGGGNDVSTNDGDALLFECWVRFNAISTGTPHGQSIMQVYRTPLAAPYVALWVNGGGGLEVALNRGGSDTTDRFSGTIVSGFAANTWYYVGAYLAFTSTGAKVWIRKDGTTTGPTTITTPSVTNAPFLNTMHVGRGTAGSGAESYLYGLIADVQLTSENTGSSSPPSWNDAFVPSAVVMPDEANLVATPPTLKEGAWGILQQLAAAEFATVGFDEQGTFQYLTRKRWTTAPYNQVQRTLDSKSSLKELTSSEAIDQVRNHVIVRAVTPKVISFGQIWVASTRYQIPGGSSKTVWMDLDGPCTNIDTSFQYSADGADGSRYLAGTVRNGSGAQISNLTFATTIVSPTRVKVVVTNPNAFTVWLTADASTPGLAANQAGSPYLILAGQRVMFETVTNPDNPTFTGSSVTTSEWSDATSIGQYGEQLLELSDNAFRQDPDQVDRLSFDLGVQLKSPKPVLPSVRIVGDPRLQLGDRDTLQDPDGLSLTKDFALAAVQTTFDEGGLDQTIGVRAT